MKINCLYDSQLQLDELVPHPKNRNDHPKEQIERLAKVLEYQGWRYPIKISKRSGYITSGHGRLEAAKLNGWTEVPVNYQDYESDEQEYADLVADNAIASWAELNLAGINADLTDLGPDFDINLLGIKDFVIEPAEKIAPGCDEDEVPDVQEVPKTRPGDVFILGNHRLMCGDSTDIVAVEKLMNGEKADITFTSPPYNAGCFGYDGGKDKYKGKSDNKDQSEYFDFLVGFTNIALEVSSYVFFNNQFLYGNRHALAKFFGHYSDYVKDVFPWIKNTAPPNVNPGFFTNRFEFFLCLEKDCSKKGFPVDWQGKYHNVIEGHTAAKDNITEGTHSATMPIYVPEWFLERLQFVKSVYEPFGGSGTTLIACEKTNRRCFMMELDPHYCDVIVARWEKYTGNKAELISPQTSGGIAQ
jgi:DNA modification methylase